MKKYTKVVLASLLFLSATFSNIALSNGNPTEEKVLECNKLETIEAIIKCFEG